MKKTSESLGRRLRRHVKFSHPAQAPLNGRKKRWLVIGLILGLLALVGYLGYAGHLGKPGAWRMALGPVGQWLWPPKAVEEDNPEDPTEPAINSRTPPAKGPGGMVWIPGGWYWRGCEEFPDALPLRKIYVEGFWMDATTVTNKQFKIFVDETGYKTVAERKPQIEDVPGYKEKLIREGWHPDMVLAVAAAPGMGFPGSLSWGGLFHSMPALEAGSLVFTPPLLPVPLDNANAWWQYLPGASWRFPEGPGKPGSDQLADHPAVHICWFDAVEFCKWRSKEEGKKFRLPTEAEWEFAARGGLDRKLYVWGDDLTPGGKWRCNIWQGPFPVKNDLLDGYESTAPVGSFPANGYGLYDMSGNVWQWCSDYYLPDYYKDSPNKNPQGPAWSYDPNEVGQHKRVQRGGSFLCCDNYCARYLPGARMKGEPTSAANHIGFRCVAER
jgi:formylglycine-generating enzyme required for sulfatase activity